MNKEKTIKKMKLVIPAMILCLIGDYGIGVEPSDSMKIGAIASSGWSTISDLRIAISNICGMIGTFLYVIGAVAFMKWLSEANKNNQSKWDNRFLKLFYFSLCIGCVSFLYIHIACGGLIQHYNVLYELSGQNAEAAEAALLRMFRVEAIPFMVTLVLFDVLVNANFLLELVHPDIEATKDPSALITLVPPFEAVYHPANLCPVFDAVGILEAVVFALPVYTLSEPY